VHRSAAAAANIRANDAVRQEWRARVAAVQAENAGAWPMSGSGSTRAIRSRSNGRTMRVGWLLLLAAAVGAGRLPGQTIHPAVAASS